MFRGLFILSFCVALFSALQKSPVFPVKAHSNAISIQKVFPQTLNKDIIEEEGEDTHLLDSVYTSVAIVVDVSQDAESLSCVTTLCLYYNSSWFIGDLFLRGPPALA